MIHRYGFNNTRFLVRITTGGSPNDWYRCSDVDPTLAKLEVENEKLNKVLFQIYKQWYELSHYDENFKMPKDENLKSSFSKWRTKWLKQALKEE